MILCSTVHFFFFFTSNSPVDIIIKLNDLIFSSSKVQANFNATNYTVKCPVGVAGLISPWNLPLYLLSFKIAPAMVCGNTIVAKPSEMTSVSAKKLCKVFQEAGKLLM